jgi:hypothetical protein
MRAPQRKVRRVLWLTGEGSHQHATGHVDDRTALHRILELLLPQQLRSHIEVATEAWSILVAVSQHANVKLRVVAEAGTVAATGQPMPPPGAGAPGGGRAGLAGGA